MDVSTIRIRHYAPEGAECGPVQETYETLSNMVEQLGPKLEKMGFPVTLEKVSSGGDPAKNNMVTMESEEIEFPETPSTRSWGSRPRRSPATALQARVTVTAGPSRSAAIPTRRSHRD